ncbi:MAG TPA: FAD-dependent oxidoreductase [Pseudogracilibacillus sp.]|nr:FAD-dependent oxidoreductase [Pseudogracilibacillus sp.]
MYDVLIVGAGPSGLAAGIACREHDLNVKIIDEFPQAGGRLLGQLHEEPNGEWWNGIKETEKLLQKAKDLHVDISCLISVYHIEKLEDSFKTHTNKGVFSSKKILIATGAAETAAPIPGWTLPGVMSIGAAQVMTNVHRVRVGNKGIVVGVNVLSAAITRELQLAGVDVHSMALPAMNIVTQDEAHPDKVMQNLVRIAHLAPSKFIRFGSNFAKIGLIRKLVVKFFPKKGIKMWDMPIHLRKAVLEINGTDKVESVTMGTITSTGKLIKGTEETIPVDFVCIAGGLYPLAELASVVGCPFKYMEELGGHVPVHNDKMETPVPGVYVSGNITGIESAKVAREQGTVAGLSMSKSLISKNRKIKKQLKKAVRNVEKTREAASIQFHPEINEGRKKIHKSFKEIN